MISNHAVFTLGFVDPKTNIITQNLEMSVGGCWAFLQNNSMIGNEFDVSDHILQNSIRKNTKMILYVSDQEYDDLLIKNLENLIDFKSYQRFLATMGSKIQFVHADGSVSEEFSNKHVTGIGIDLITSKWNPLRTYILFTLIRPITTYFDPEIYNGSELQIILDTIKIKKQFPKWQSIKCYQLALLTNVFKNRTISDLYDIVSDKQFYQYMNILNSAQPCMFNPTLIDHTIGASKINKLLSIEKYNLITNKYDNNLFGKHSGFVLKSGVDAEFYNNLAIYVAVGKKDIIEKNEAFYKIIGLIEKKDYAKIKLLLNE